MTKDAEMGTSLAPYATINRDGIHDCNSVKENNMGENGMVAPGRQRFGIYNSA